MFEYHFWLTIHILTVVIGLGHTFLYPIILNLPKKKEHVSFVYMVTNRLNTIAKYSDYILLFSGIALVLVTHYSFKDEWIILSLVLIVSIRISSRFLSKKTSKRLKEIMENIHNNEVKDYKNALRPYFKKLYVTQTLNLAIILVMIWKPSFIA